MSEIPKPRKKLSKNYPVQKRRNKNGLCLIYECNLCPYVGHEYKRVVEHQIRCFKRKKIIDEDEHHFEDVKEKNE